MKRKILDVKNLSTSFKNNKQKIVTVDNISFEVFEGETLGIVGESGCGKSLTSLSVMGLIKPPGEVKADAILFDDIDLSGVSKKKFRGLRGDQLSMIFQEPMTSLNPVYKVGDQIGESLKIHKSLSKAERHAVIVNLLKEVGIARAAEIADCYPHQLSGGMRQRVMIAIAIACNPKLIIADEPTTALDVTIQAQILELLKKLQRENNTAMILITHDLGVVSEACDRVLVMYAGRIVESGEVKSVLSNPLHPYTKGLLASLPKNTPPQSKLPFIPGQVPPPVSWGKGCRFADRCPFAEEKCRTEQPPFFQAADEKQVACWLYEEERTVVNA
ncbi:ABC transporter ATP-binding protein [Sporosarcina contaminans]|uniref:ABC transporter ATP-binding protein n=1 Tax=Sporosarcina contaminans TaxID=633403 RepID=A0ABW3TXX8_9BACL